ncbi:hypothetical protein [Yinghuangia sp. YIM S09857]|uniref:hypothetical protein n=1 Tax=Yinghuangia sp. YIM S09857 TaxID=3436929 RepID=UPI003F52F36F
MTTTQFVVFWAIGGLGDLALLLVILVVLQALGIAVTRRYEVSKSRAWTEKAVKVIEEHPWQVWPCRVEKANPEKTIHHRFVMRSAERADMRVLATSVFVRVMLLAPDGSVARRYASRIPDDVWRGFTDGLGALWICGDLRFEIILATPGAQDCWPGTLLPELTTRPTLAREHRENADDIGVIAREAGSWALSQWLG